jgi:N-acetylglucosaminyldiphosphoundecaprenol N-acetyl-beta-D-mannosaminyltransferase
VYEATKEQSRSEDRLHKACATCRRSRNLSKVNSVSFDVLHEEEFVRRVEEFGRCGSSHVVHFLAAHPTVVARSDSNYRALLEDGDMVVSDGSPIAVTMRLRGHDARRITSTDAFLRICADGVGRGRRHFFVGGSDDEVAQAFGSNLRLAFPQLKMVGHEVPPFRAYEEGEFGALAEAIRHSRADFVWVGLGAPKQDLLAHRLRAANVAPVIATIGATFDFVAGSKSRAPTWLRAIGLEWIYRLAQEPRRLWRRYTVGNAQFIAGVLLGLARHE